MGTQEAIQRDATDAKSKVNKLDNGHIVILYFGRHRFTISTYEAALQPNGNLRVQFNEGRGQQGIRTIKISEFENTRIDVNNVTINEFTQIVYTNQRHLATKVNADIDFTDESVLQYDVPDVENTFVDECK